MKKMVLVVFVGFVLTACKSERICRCDDGSKVHLNWPKKEAKIACDNLSDSLNVCGLL